MPWRAFLPWLLPLEIRARMRTSRDFQLDGTLIIVLYIQKPRYKRTDASVSKNSYK